MTNGYFKLAFQIGGGGAFAAVKLDVHESPGPIRIDVAASGPIAAHYVSAAKTGIEFAHDRLILEGQFPPQVIVTILEISESPVDTRAMLVVYASCNAYCEAIGMHLKRPIEIDREKCRIIFPL